MTVTKQYPAVHTLDLHNGKQTTEETVKTFAARVLGITAICELYKTCPTAMSSCASRITWYLMSLSRAYGTRSCRRSVLNMPS